MSETAGLGYLLVLLVIYFVPWIIAASRNHHQRSAICLLNLLLGWTVLGWVVALIWAATAVRREPTVVIS